MRLYLFAWLLVASLPLQAGAYPDMVGVWEGRVRTVSSGSGTEGTVARGGMMIDEVDLKVTIEAQEEETFMGKTRSSATPPNQPSPRVWGTIRSDGSEAMFITSTGGRGTLWFRDGDRFEYCITNLQDGTFTAYCAELTKQP